MKALPSAPRRAWWTLALLSTMFVLSLVDRFILSLLIAPLKRDLGITDVQIGLLLGTAFAIVYGSLGVPIARMADRGNRRLLILGGLIVWSLSTAASSLATSFGMLIVLRFGVALGEAALVPATYSLIGDMFPLRQRTLAASIFSGVGSAGAGASFILGGLIVAGVNGLGKTVPLLAEIPMWRTVLVAVGLPGLLLAPLLLLVSEPARSDGHAAAASGGGQATGAHLSAHVPMYMALAACAISGMIGYAFVAWTPELLMRKFALSSPEVGTTLGAMLIITILIGSLAGPRIADRLMQGGRRDGYPIVFIGSMIILAMSSVAACMQPSWQGFLAFYAIASTMTAACSNSALASLQLVVPGHIRATVTACYLLFLNLIGLGIGPAAAAWFAQTPLAMGTGLSGGLAVLATLAAVPSVLLLLNGRRDFIRRVAAVEAQAGIA